MAEFQVTVDGVSRRLPDPFLLIATENPIEQEGTFPLPEAQLDRFLLRTSLGYPTLDEEIRILDDQLHGHPLDAPAAGGRRRRDLRVLRDAVEHVYVDPLLKRWAVDLVRATRELDFLELGASVRASLALDRVGPRAGRSSTGARLVVPDDVERALRLGRHPPACCSARSSLVEELSQARSPSRLGGVSRACAPSRAGLGRRDARAA